jgi:hypothetical protein
MPSHALERCWRWLENFELLGCKLRTEVRNNRQIQFHSHKRPGTSQLLLQNTSTTRSRYQIEVESIELMVATTMRYTLRIELLDWHSSAGNNGKEQAKNHEVCFFLIESCNELHGRPEGIACTVVLCPWSFRRWRQVSKFFFNMLLCMLPFISRPAMIDDLVIIQKIQITPHILCTKALNFDEFEVGPPPLNQLVVAALLYDLAFG